ncbi:MAG: Lrp/AsnC family transcriptional regulator [Methanomassiliicoccaceae archaeon]|jgi:DNA-binding Lrp family transcriptional regulator|nr:Lrp/AsnC family transcriptional regulator [Methanomassiliicoccaceae archaeon]HPP45402.1 Lrp/AsnC family transcriptional regulator [Methanomassiliicoccaceae archaeon]
MDPTDISILKCLRENSRDSLGKISEELNISKATVSRRLSKMEEEGIISGYSMETNPAKLGLMKALVGLQVTGTAVNNVVEELKKYPEVESVMRTFGDHSLVLNIYTTSVDSLYELIQTHILKIPNINNVEVDIIIDSVTINPNAELDLYQKKIGNLR